MKSSRLTYSSVLFPMLKTVMVVTAVIICCSIPVAPQISALIAAGLSGLTASQVAGAAATAISTGSSVASAVQAANSGGFGVTCVIEVENWTKHDLENPIVQITNAGSLVTLAKNVMPAERQAFTVRKPASSATGVYGTVSWDLGTTGRRVVVMWSTPYNFNFNVNYMAVGLTKNGTHVPGDKTQWFNQMYYGVNTDSLKFTLGEFYNSLNPIYYREDHWEIMGSMNNIHQAKIRVVVRPQMSHPEDFATPILIKLEALQKNETHV